MNIEQNTTKYKLTIADKLYIPRKAIQDESLFKAVLTAHHKTEGTIKLFKYSTRHDLYIVDKGYFSKIDDNLYPFFISDYQVTDKLQNSVEFIGDLRPEQKELMEDWDSRKNDSGLIVARAGFGKTVIGAKIIADTQYKTIILVPTIRILKQWQQSLETFLGYAPGIIGDGICDIQDITVASPKSLKNKELFNEQVKKRFALVIVDEGHKAAAPQLLNLSTSFYAANRIGFTATPFRKDGMHFHLEGIFGNQKFEQLPKGQKAKIRIVHTDFNFPFGGVSSYNDALDYLSNNRKFNDFVAKKIEKDYIRKRRIIVLSPRLKHLDALCKSLETLDIPYGWLKSEKTKADKLANEKILYDIHYRHIVLLGTDSLIGTGFDEPSLDCMHVPYSMNNPQLFIQYIGRIERKYPNKPIPEYVDYFFLPKNITAYQQNCRIDYYSQLNYDIFGED